MLSVRKEELLSNGLIGIACVLFSLLDFFTNRDILAYVTFAIIIVVYAAAYIYRGKAQHEPWDEFTTENYANARRITLLFVEFTLLVWGIICIFGQLQVPIKACHILLYYGAIKLVQTGAFLYFDSSAGK